MTIHEHLDGTVSIRYGPHVVGRYDQDRRGWSARERKSAVEKAGSVEAGENQKQVSTGSHTPLEISQRREIPTFPPRRRRLLFCPREKQKPNPKGGGLTAASLCFTKRTDHV